LTAQDDDWVHGTNRNISITKYLLTARYECPKRIAGKDPKAHGSNARFLRLVSVIQIGVFKSLSNFKLRSFDVCDQ